MRPDPGALVEEQALLRMARAIRHRGPDGFGLALDRGAGFVCARLAIFDLAGGWQPLETNPGEGLIVYNGEVFNHPELREELRAAGERFRTTSDTEVVLRLLEHEGLDALQRLNGQFALAWWRPAARRLVLVRDRFGVRPLFYSARPDGTVVFGSEAKALFASGEVTPEPDLRGVDDVFSLWGPQPPQTPFQGVRQLPPGGILVWERGRVVDERRWWSPRYGADAADESDLPALLSDSVRLRLRADVPVGAFLSGGLDSSLTTVLAREVAGERLRTFSIAFSDPRFDERRHQESVARALGVTHHAIEVGPAEIAAAFPAAIRHVEAPLVRTAPVPLLLLAREVRRQGITAVVTGEGADELFWGYDLFKEVALRELHRQEPERAIELLDQLYPYLGSSAARRTPAWRHFLLETGAGDDPLGSHLTRVQATGTVKAFYRPEVAAELRGGGTLQRLRSELPDGFRRWSAGERAAWLEIATLLSPYLLAAQGDRVAMAHGVEGRFPFLDHRVFALAAGLPPERKLDGLREKVALRELAAELLPPDVVSRPKQPYRAPEVAPFFGREAPGWVQELLSPRGLAEAGIFDEQPVRALVRRCREGRVGGVREQMALVGILSTGLWHRSFFGPDAGRYPPETAEPRVRVDRTAEQDLERA